MTDLVVYQFRGVNNDHKGDNSLLTAEPYINRTVVQSLGAQQWVGVHSLADYAAVMASSGGAAFWYNTFANVATGTNVVSAGFPERKVVLDREGDYEMIALPRNGQLGFRSS